MDPSPAQKHYAMELTAIAQALLIAIATSLLLYLLARPKKLPAASGKLPPGSLGPPVVGQSLGLLRAMRSNMGERWLRRRIERYGVVSKLSLFGTPTVFLAGPAANRFLFVSEALALQQPRSVPLILGERNVLELVGDDHRRVRGAIAQFLKPDMLRTYIGKIDAEVRYHVDNNWVGRNTVTVMPLMQSLTFDIISSVLFGLERGPVRERLAGDFRQMIEGMWAVPISLPGTAFRRSLRASARARCELVRIVGEKRTRLERGGAPGGDLISHLLGPRGGGGHGAAPLLTEEEIVDNARVVLVAGFDTTAVLLTFMVRHLAEDPATLSAMVQEHEDIAKNKATGEALTWEDLTKMKYTWRVALETLRVIPPVFGSFRRALQDIEFEGYHIPKGWHVFWAPFVTHMDADIFPEPAKFDPSRFDGQPPPHAFVAFGGGPRVCPGMEFARIETLVTMHYLVRQFRWKLCCKENTFRRDPMPTPLRGLPISLEHRASLK